VANIHARAIVSPQAHLGQDVMIGPFCIVDADVVLGDGCRLESNVVIQSGVLLGENNHICEGAVIGGLAQHTNRPVRAGTVRIGSNNSIREFVTIHRALEEGQATTIGDDNLLMISAHVAHDCSIGNGVIVTNNVMLAGHVSVGDQAYLAGAVGVHQFCRIGRLAMVGGQARIKKDVPPFVVIDDATSFVVGLNLVGLRRADFTKEQIARLKAAYRLIYRSGLPWQQMLARLKTEFTEHPTAEFSTFFSGGSRGFTPERRRPATLKLHSDTAQLRAKAS